MHLQKIVQRDFLGRSKPSACVRIHQCKSSPSRGDFRLGFWTISSNVYLLPSRGVNVHYITSTLHGLKQHTAVFLWRNKNNKNCWGEIWYWCWPMNCSRTAEMSNFSAAKSYELAELPVPCLIMCSALHLCSTILRHIQPALLRPVCTTPATCYPCRPKLLY